MASVGSPGLLSFASLRMEPGLPENYRKAGNMLLILGWIHVVGVAVTILVGGLMVLLFGGMGIAMGAFMSRFLGPFPVLMEGAFLAVAIVMVAVGVAIGLALLYWNSWVYAKWVGREPRAIQHSMIFAIVIIVLDGMSALQGNILAIGGLVLAILVLVWGQSDESKAVFQASPLPARPDGWTPVE